MLENKIIRNLANGNKSFAFTYRKDNGFRFYFHPDGCSKNVNINNFNGFVFAPFDNNSIWPTLFLQPSIYYESNSLDELLQFVQIGDADSGDFEEYEHTSISKASYLNMISNAIDHISSDLPKIVLSRINTCEKNFDVLIEFERLQNKYPSNLNYIFYSKESGLWMGSTPENLIYTKNKKGYTCALAGTKSLDESWSEKEKIEQKFVKDYLLSALNKYSSNVECKDEVLTIGSINHLKTNFNFDLNKGINFKQLIEDLHPTPAVGGYPKDKSMEYIHFNEPHDRMYYSGYLGEVCSPSEFNLFVNLRCMNISKDKVYYFLGGGITKDSIPEKEFIETQRKMNTLIEP